MIALYLFAIAGGIVGAVYFKKKKLMIPMFGSIVVSTAGAFLLVCTLWLVWAID